MCKIKGIKTLKWFALKKETSGSFRESLSLIELKSFLFSDWYVLLRNKFTIDVRWRNLIFDMITKARFQKIVALSDSEKKIPDIFDFDSMTRKEMEE